MLSFYQGKKVFITGGLGFIGSNLAVALARRGADVTVADSREPACGANDFNLAEEAGRVRLLIADIGDAARIGPALAGSDVIFNLAGEISHIHSIRFPERDLDLNVRSQLGFLESCRQAAPRARIIYASSRQVYGIPDYLPVDEQHPVRPVDFNGLHLWAAENYHFLFSNLYGLDVACLRLTNVYGPRQALLRPCQGFIGVFFRLALRGEKIEVFGDGRQLRDMLYVDDAVDAFLLAGATPFVQKVYNVGGAPPSSLLEIAQAVARAAGGVPIECIPFPEDRKPIDIGSYYSDITRIRGDLGWEPRTDFERGAAETVAFYRRFAEHYLHGPVHPLCQLETRARQLPARVAGAAD
ncbi:MAG TPA: NAD-dependent epimerase/dehydratase family protein [Bryobacterales bacterium]|nr:NAD-dependent epimerase/dehydratase family protein [Bryobacterales bacterium]